MEQNKNNPTQPQNNPISPTNGPEPAPDNGTPTPTQPEAPAQAQVAQPIQPQAPVANTEPASSPAASGVVTPPSSLTDNIQKNGNSNNQLVKKILAGMFAIAAIIAIYVFAFYLPNTPESVWSSGLNNSGKALESILDKLSEEDKFESFSKSQITLTADANWADFDIEGSIDSKFDQTKSNSNLSVDATGEGQSYKFNLDLITSLPENSYFPDMYYRLTGLTDAANNTAYEDIADIVEDRWIRVSSEYIEQSYGSYYDKQDEDTAEPVTNEDVAEYIELTADLSRKYVFTDNPEFAIINNEGFLEEEETEGVTAYRYDASLNKENLAKLCVEASNRALDLSVTKKLSGLTDDEIAKEKESIDEDCQDESSDIEESKFVIWMNKSTKLVHKARFFSSQNDKTTYTDVGQKYEGKDTIEFFVNYVDESESTTVKTTVMLNIDDLSTTGTLSAVQSTDNGYEVNAQLDIKPHEGDVQADTPTDFTDIEDLMQEIYGGYSLGASTDESNISPIEQLLDMLTITNE